MAFNEEYLEKGPKFGKGSKIFLTVSRKASVGGREKNMWIIGFLYNYVREQVNEEQCLTVRGPAQDCFLSAAPPLSTCTAVLHRADFSIIFVFHKKDKSVQL